MPSSAAPLALRQPVHSHIVELRQYTLHPDARDTLIDLFDRELIESQEACGMSVIGQFRDLDRPDRFVWLRGFADMESRSKALAGFYGGPAWAEHRAAANATMIDFDDVRLLRPAFGGSVFDLDVRARPPHRAPDASAELIVATICPLPAGDTQPFAEWFHDHMQPLLEATGSRIVACLVTEASVNTFPQLPVREGEDVLVFISAFADAPAHARHQAAMSVTAGAPQATALMRAKLTADPAVLRLQPTARSLLRG